MKGILILLGLIGLFSGCASSGVVKDGPCDSVSNRDDVQVCGQKDVMKKCRQVVGRPEFVCDAL